MAFGSSLQSLLPMRYYRVHDEVHYPPRGIVHSIMNHDPGDVAGASPPRLRDPRDMECRSAVWSHPQAYRGTVESGGPGCQSRGGWGMLQSGTAVQRGERPSPEAGPGVVLLACHSEPPGGCQWPAGVGLVARTDRSVCSRHHAQSLDFKFTDCIAVPTGGPQVFPAERGMNPSPRSLCTHRRLSACGS